jgi:hypothetical protein
MDPGTGRHRKRGARGLVAVGLFLAVGAAFLGGMATDRFLTGDPASGASASSPGSGAPASKAPASKAPASATAPGSSSPVDRPPDATATSAHPDPDPPGPQGSDAFFARLGDEGLPVDQHREAILVLGRMVCQAPPSDRANTDLMATRVATIAGDLLSPGQTRQLALLAAQELCGT